MEKLIKQLDRQTAISIILYILSFVSENEKEQIESYIKAIC